MALPLAMRRQLEQLDGQVGEESVDVGPGIEQQLAQGSGTGSPLPESVRSYMEPRFGTDFSGVRVHAGSASQHLNRSLNAQAFTVGQDIYYGASKSPTDLSLTAHELTHVVQQDCEQLQRARTHAMEAAARAGAARAFAFGQTSTSPPATMRHAGPTASDCSRTRSRIPASVAAPDGR